MYGFRVEIPRDWRVELNPKTNRQKGDVAFHSPRGNKFFISWGNLDEATKRFASLQEYRDNSIKQIRSGRDVKGVSVESSHEETLSGHTALFSHIKVEIRSGGAFSKSSSDRGMSSVHLYCPSTSRYYVAYFLWKDPDEYQNLTKMFEVTVRSFVCH